jgi:hypothetical protein
MADDKPSGIDARLLVDKETWVVSMVRRQNSDNPFHTFLVLEGMTQFEQALLRRFDLYIDKTDDKMSVIVSKGGVYAPEQAGESLKDLLRLHDNGDQLLYRSFELSKNKALGLIQVIEYDKEHPPRYAESGHEGVCVSQEDAHSCFTWARAKLNNLKEPHIEIAHSGWDKFVAFPPNYLTGANTPARSCALM